jgi:formylglycine-generating enzyme required for sulfatase activity
MRRAWLVILAVVAAGTAAQAQQAYRDCAQCPEMVRIPPGSFVMGSTPEVEQRDGVPDDHVATNSPMHRVTIARGFSLGRYEVTRGEFAAFVAATAREMPMSCWGPLADGVTKHEFKDRNWEKPGFAQTDRDPVVCVNWHDAVAYTEWLSQLTGKSYRLPSEAEWEYAARAGSTTRYPWGDEAAAACTQANIADLGLVTLGGFKRPNDDMFPCTDGVVFTAPAGRFGANAFGLHDMIGNVWEWTADCWMHHYELAPTDGSPFTGGTCAQRVYRGGSWGAFPWHSRSALRMGEAPDWRNRLKGFRVARSD